MGAESSGSAKKKQHVVPKFHLRHFSNNDVLNTLNIADGKEYPVNIEDACCWNYFYDKNPNAIDSMENILCHDEEELSKPINSLIDDNTSVSPDTLIRYVCMLLARSQSIAEYTSYANIDNKRKLMKNYYQHRHHLLNGEDRNLFTAIVLETPAEEEFITADIPYYCQNVCFERETSSVNDFDNEDYWAWFCPISTTKCIVIVRKSNICDMILKGIQETKGIAQTINVNLIYYANEHAFSKSSIKSLYVEYKNIKPNPSREEFHDNFSKTRKENKIYNN